MLKKISLKKELIYEFTYNFETAKVFRGGVLF